MTQDHMMSDSSSSSSSSEENNSTSLPWIWESDAPPLYRHVFNKSWSRALRLLERTSSPPAKHQRQNSSGSGGGDSSSRHGSSGTRKKSRLAPSEILSQTSWSSPRGMTALHWATIRSAPPSLVEALLCHADRHAVRKADETGRTPLHHAARFASHEVITLLVQRFPRGIDSRDRSGKTPLCLARERERAECVLNTLGNARRLHDAISERDWYTARELLRRREHQEEVTWLDRDGKTALHLASKFGMEVEMVEVVLAMNGKAAMVRDRDGMTPLHVVCAAERRCGGGGGGGKLQAGGSISREETESRVVKLLLRECREAASVRDKNGDTPLLVAIRKGKPASLIGPLAFADPMQVMAPDASGRTPLHLACEKDGADHVIRVMIASCPSATTVTDRDACTPLHIAMYFNQPATVIRFLLEANCEPVRATDKWGKTPAYYFYKHAHSVLPGGIEDPPSNATAAAAAAAQASQQQQQQQQANNNNNNNNAGALPAALPPAAAAPGLASNRNDNAPPLDTLRDMDAKLTLLLKAETHMSVSDPLPNNVEWNVVHAALMSSTLPRPLLQFLLRYHPKDALMVSTNGTYTIHCAAGARGPVQSAGFVRCNRCHVTDRECISMFFSHVTLPVFLCRDCTVTEHERGFSRPVNREKIENPNAVPLALIKQQLKFHPLAASIPDAIGSLPLNIALRANKRWNDGVKDLFKGAPTALRSRDVTTFLFPFLLAAVRNGGEGAGDFSPSAGDGVVGGGGGGGRWNRRGFLRRSRRAGGRRDRGGNLPSALSPPPASSSLPPAPPPPASVRSSSSKPSSTSEQNGTDVAAAAMAVVAERTATATTPGDRGDEFDFRRKKPPPLSSSDTAATTTTATATSTSVPSNGAAAADDPPSHGEIAEEEAGVVAMFDEDAAAAMIADEEVVRQEENDDIDDDDALLLEEDVEGGRQQQQPPVPFPDQAQLHQPIANNINDPFAAPAVASHPAPPALELPGLHPSQVQHLQAVYQQQLQQQHQQQQQQQQAQQHQQHVAHGLLAFQSHLNSHMVGGGNHQHTNNVAAGATTTADLYDQLSTVFNLLIEEPAVVEGGVLLGAVG